MPLIIAAIALILAFGAVFWAWTAQRGRARLGHRYDLAGRHATAAVAARESLLASVQDGLVAWDARGQGPFSYGEGKAFFDSILTGPDTEAFAAARDRLIAEGEPFSLSLRDDAGRQIIAAGRRKEGVSAISFALSGALAEGGNFHAALDAMPMPVWLRDKALKLAWANRAFLEATGEADAQSAREHQSALDAAERDFAAAAAATGTPLENRRFAILGGQRRALNFTHVPLADGEILGTASDVTDVQAAEARLQQHLDAHADTLDKLATAVAIYGADQKLAFYNRAYLKLWGLPEEWLDTHPAHGEVLDRLRENRKLPEQRDFKAWKRERVAMFENALREPVEELWHTTGGITLRAIVQPHPFGGLTFLYEDVTERLALESSYNTLIKVQTATLDTLKEGVAVFGPDGRLKLHNAAFARLWEFSESELAGEPHMRGIASVCRERFGEHPIWDRLIPAIASPGERRGDWGLVERNDHTILSLSLSSLPDGATLATFSDVTDRSRVEQALRDRNDALEAADRLKSDFIKHVSYELRTPLNTILGFAEHLSSGMPGALNSQQSDYVQAIITGSNSLRSLVNDILDLALIESGALRLELDPVDLYALLSEVATHAREWAGKAGLTLELACPEDSGIFLADPRRVRQIVFNLLSNAVKYTPRGGTITLGGVIRGDDVEIIVSDTGPGIAEDVKANVFERFAAHGQSGQRAGAGLGLALVNRFVELHDGWVEIDSQLDKGTTVRCHLPRRTHEAGPHVRRIA